MLYAIRGWPASGAMFLPGTRTEPPRAGTSAMALAISRPSRRTRARRPPSDLRRVVGHVHGLEVRVHLDRLGAGLPPARAGVALAAERPVRLGAVGRAVDGGHAGADALHELLPAMDRARPDRGRQAVGRRVGELDRLVEAGHAVQRRDRPEQLGGVQLVRVLD